MPNPSKPRLELTTQREPTRPSLPFGGRSRRAPDDGLHLSDVGVLIQQRKLFIAVVMGIVFVVIMAATLASRMEFQSVARLYLGELGEGTRGSGKANDLEIGSGDQSDVGSEIEIIKSRSLVTRGIYASGLNAKVSSPGQEPPRYWRWLLSKRDPALLDVQDANITVVDAALSSRFQEEQSFTVRARENGEYELLSKRGKLGQGRFGESLRTADLTVTLLVPEKRKPGKGRTFELRVAPIEKTVDDALKKLQVTAPRQGTSTVNVVTLAFTAHSPVAAAKFLEKLMVSYLAERQEWKTEDATAAEAFLSSQLVSTKETLDKIEAKLADYRKTNRVVVLDNGARAMIEQIARYEEQRVGSRLELAALEEIEKALAKPEPPSGAYLFGETNDTVLQGMAASLSDARQKLVDLEARFNDAAPDVREQRAQIDSQLRSIRGYVSSRVSRARQNLNSFNGIIGQFESRLRSVPGAEVGLAQLSRESEVYSRTYSFLLERQQQTAITKASTLSKNRILDFPKAIPEEHSPQLKTSLIGSLIGVLIGVMLVVLRGVASRLIQTEGAMRRALRHGPAVLGIVPRRASASQIPTDRSSSPDVFVEALRLIRTNLYRLGWQFANTGKAILVTSPSLGDGKTTITQALAAGLAADGRRVLVIDADPKGTPRSLSGDTDATGATGLLGALTGHVAWRDELARVRSSGSEFHWLESGGRVSAESLGGPQMARLLSEARESFDFVLIDAPAFPRLSDALVLSFTCDCVLTIVRVQKTERAALADHLAQLKGASDLHLAIINDGRRRVQKPRLFGRAEPTPMLPSAKSVGPRRKTAWWMAAALAIGLVIAVMVGTQVNTVEAFPRRAAVSPTAGF